MPSELIESQIFKGGYAINFWEDNDMRLMPLVIVGFMMFIFGAFPAGSQEIDYPAAQIKEGFPDGEVDMKTLDTPSREMLFFPNNSSLFLPILFFSLTGIFLIFPFIIARTRSNGYYLWYIYGVLAIIATVTFFPLGLALLPALIAKSKGKEFSTWYIYGVLLFIIALIHAVTLKVPYKECPECRTKLDVGEISCSYCNRNIIWKTKLIPTDLSSVFKKVPEIRE